MVAIGGIIIRRIKLPSTASFMLCFMIVAFVTWEYLFSYFTLYRWHRSFLQAFAVTIFLLTYVQHQTTRNMALVINALIVGITLYTTTYPNWGRTSYQQYSWHYVSPILPKHSTIVLADEATAYVIPGIVHSNPDTTFIGLRLDLLGKHALLTREVRYRIQHHQGPIYALWLNDNAILKKVLPAVGLAVAPSCTDTTASFTDQTIHLCSARLITGASDDS